MEGCKQTNLTIRQKTLLIITNSVPLSYSVLGSIASSPTNLGLTVIVLCMSTCLFLTSTGLIFCVKASVGLSSFFLFCHDVPQEFSLVSLSFVFSQRTPAADKNEILAKLLRIFLWRPRGRTENKLFPSFFRSLCLLCSSDFADLFTHSTPNISWAASLRSH